MKQIVQDLKSGELRVEEVPVPLLKPGGVLVQVRTSLISAGTERMTLEFSQKNLLEKALSRPDLVKKVINKAKNEGILGAFRSAMSQLETHFPLGYSTAGVVIDKGGGVEEFNIGDRVACAGGGFACHAEVNFIPKNLCVKLPNNVSFEEGSFTTLGAIALQGIRLAELTLGEKVVVIGLGLLGQLTVQLVKANGCKVLGVDIDQAKVVLAKELGADEALTTGDDIEGKVMDFTNGIGADAVIITAATSSNDPVELAGKISRLKGRIIAVGAVGLAIPRKIYYEKELSLKVSMSYGPGRYDSSYEEKGIDYPLAYVRWTEKRNMEAFVELVSQAKVNLAKIITHRFEINDAQRAYEMIMEGKERHLGVLLSYPAEINLEHKIELKAAERASTQNVVVGFIGAGNYAKIALLPALCNLKEVFLRGLASATGTSSCSSGKRFGFQYVTTDLNEIFRDQEINTVFIATRHDMHADLVIRALEKDLNVFVEKPLAINAEDLEKIITVCQKSKGVLQVGFNRRFSPAALAAKSFFKDRMEPLLINYRVNAGFIPKTHWVSDPKIGGGRIIGEVCHFIDLMIYLIGSMPRRVFAEAISPETENMVAHDNLSITLKFADGSVGTIGYFSNGDKALPKERVEIFGEGKVFIIDDFKNYESIENGNKRVKKNFQQNKGQANEVRAFLTAIKTGKFTIPFEDIILATKTAFKILDSLKSGNVENVEISRG